MSVTFLCNIAGNSALESVPHWLSRERKVAKRAARLARFTKTGGTTIDPGVTKRRDEILRLAEAIREAKQIAASIAVDRITSSLMLQETAYLGLSMAAELLEQRLAQLAYAPAKGSDEK